MLSGAASLLFSQKFQFGFFCAAAVAWLSSYYLALSEINKDNQSQAPRMKYQQNYLESMHPSGNLRLEERNQYNLP
ncbi:hypothetical protein CWI78_10685 [Idiomarina ramblicola]|uniref:Uncharacterized protein n=1 Tax=Idiomarina ramblicola TaxID=263724 RepID=A0A432YUG5_9GAMM|nr:hypothetical protein CWI78_10685 [Idiomarina ramblicola]